jgi:hypothetical protein
MQNAHERFGSLEFTKRTKDTTTRTRIHIDRAVLEPAKDGRGQVRAHLLSMIGEEHLPQRKWISAGTCDRLHVTHSRS